MIKLYILIFMIVTLHYGKTSASIAQATLNFPLPRAVKPLHYDLEIFSDLIALTFWGTVHITVKCDVPTKQIILHHSGLEIDDNNILIKQLPVISDPPSIIHVLNHNYTPESNQYMIELEKSLEQDTSYKIELKFSGRFFANSKGYITLTHARTAHFAKRIAYTKLDKTGARQIFPCFDEMGLKATFTVQIGRPTSMRGFSNANFRLTAEVLSPPDWVKDEFHTTVLMEPSALAIVLLTTDYETKALEHNFSNIKIRILAGSVTINKLGYFHVLVSRIFNFFWNYFGAEYAVEKLDVFVLRLSKSRASSLYGVIYISESKIFDLLKEPSSFAGYEVVSELCHVMSKQWIGYTATMSSIQDDYLHTALNLVLQTMCVAEIGNSINVKWEVKFLDLGFLTFFLEFLQFFGEKQYHPILLMGRGLESFFDHTAWKLPKAYLLFRTMRDILGDTLFQKCIFNYMTKFTFANSDKKDLWDAFTHTINEIRPTLLSNYELTVEDISESWIDQAGYPLITVIRNDSKKEIIISQEPFHLSEREEREDMPKRCWLIPVSYITKSESRSNGIKILSWLTCKGPLVFPISVPQDDWILFDFNANGRINYDPLNWNLIVKSLVEDDDPNVFDRLVRARLTSDMFALADVGKLSYQIVLDAMKYLPREIQHENLQLVLDKFNEIRLRLLGTSIYKSFKKYVRRLLEPVFNREEFKNLLEYPVGINVDIKVKIIWLSCEFGVELCRQQCLRIPQEQKNDRVILEVPETVLTTIHCQRVKHGNSNLWNSIRNSLDKTEERETRRQILKALTCSTKVRLLKRLLNMSINGEKIKNFESITIIKSLLSNRKGYRLVKMFLTRHYDEISNFYNSMGNPSDITVYWNSLLDATVRKEDLKELMALAYSKKVYLSSSTSTMFKGYESAMKNVLWFARSKETFARYFSHGIFNVGWIKF